jgi:hypothetical protein
MWWSRERSRKEDASHCDVTRVIYTFPNLNLNPLDPLPSQPTGNAPKCVRRNDMVRLYVAEVNGEVEELMSSDEEEWAGARMKR